MFDRVQIVAQRRVQRGGVHRQGVVVPLEVTPRSLRSSIAPPQSGRRGIRQLAQLVGDSFHVHVAVSVPGVTVPVELVVLAVWELM